MDEQLDAQSVINSLSRQVQEYSTKLAYSEALLDKSRSEAKELQEEVEQLRKEKVEEMDAESETDNAN